MPTHTLIPGHVPSFLLTWKCTVCVCMSHETVHLCYSSMCYVWVCLCVCHCVGYLFLGCLSVIILHQLLLMLFPLLSSLCERHPPPLSCPVSWQRQALWFGDIQLVSASEEKMLQSNKCSPLIPMEALKPRLQLQRLPLSASPNLPVHPLFKSTVSHFHRCGFTVFLDLSPLLYTHSEHLAQLLSLRGHPKVWKESFCFSGGWKTKCFPSQVKITLSPCGSLSSCRIQYKFSILTPH